MALALEGLTLRRGGFRLAADLALAPGGLVALIGPSGGGKSTLIEAVAGFERPEAGRIRVAGQDVTDLPPAARPVTILFQDHNLFPHLDAFENVALGLRPDLRLRPEDRAAVRAALASVGLAELGRRRPAALSGGQRSRVALARVLLRRRPLLLLDEPFAALGPALRREMLDLVARIAGEAGMTVLMATHDPADARRICSHAVLVAEGRAEPPRPLDAFFGNPAPALRAYLGD